jgi:hypothetical protein
LDATGKSPLCGVGEMALIIRHHESFACNECCVDVAAESDIAGEAWSITVTMVGLIRKIDRNGSKTFFGFGFTSKSEHR